MSVPSVRWGLNLNWIISFKSYRLRVSFPPTTMNIQNQLVHCIPQSRNEFLGVLHTHNVCTLHFAGVLQHLKRYGYPSYFIILNSYLVYVFPWVRFSRCCLIRSLSAIDAITLVLFNDFHVLTSPEYIKLTYQLARGYYIHLQAIIPLSNLPVVPTNLRLAPTTHPSILVP